MNKYSTKYFGEIDIDAVEEGYDSTIEFKGKTVTLDLNILGTKQIESFYIKVVDDFIDDLQTYEASIHSALKKDLKEKGATFDYIDSQLEELDKEEMSALLANTDTKLTKRQRVLSILSLIRIGFYPEKDDKTLAVFDYSIGEELTDELLVVNISKGKEIQWITIES